MTDFNSEFTRLFSNGSCSISGYDWNKSRYFDGTNSASCYANETALISSLTSEAYNKYGFEVQYYIKQISTNRNKILGEDPLENILRRFKLSVYTETVPTLQKQYLIQGMQYTELITLQCTIQHFNEASVYNFDRTKQEYDIYVPKIGDIMYFEYSKLYYEIINVKAFAEGSTFLSKPITYTFTLKIWKNNHEDVDVMNQNSDDMPIEDYTSLAESFNIENKTSNVNASGDILAINDVLNKNSAVLYDNGKTVNENDPFNGW